MSDLTKVVRSSDGVKKGGYTPSGQVSRPSGAPPKPADAASSAKPTKA